MRKTMRDLFGVPSDMEVEVGDRTLSPAEGGMKHNPEYVWRKKVLRDLLTFWTSGRRSAMIQGPKGCGKTTGPEQWHAVLKLPMVCIGGHKRISEEHLFGKYLPTPEGGLVWDDGPVMHAARHGMTLLFNEFNAVDPGITILLNDIAQTGSVVTNPLTKEAVDPHPNFRIIATVNPAGSMYEGRMDVDSSTRERFFHMKWGFPKQEDEKRVLVPIWKRFGYDEASAEEFADNMIRVAAAVRATSMDVSNRPDAIPETLSTRVLINWAHYWGMLSRSQAAVHRGLEKALTNSCEATAKTAIHRHVHTVFGVEYVDEED